LIDGGFLVKGVVDDNDDDDDDKSNSISKVALNGLARADGYSGV
jgi:hypothetical protein